MIPTHRVPTHPGEILQDEYWGPLGLTQVKLAEHIGVAVRTSLRHHTPVLGQSAGEL